MLGTVPHLSQHSQVPPSGRDCTFHLCTQLSLSLGLIPPRLRVLEPERGLTLQRSDSWLRRVQRSLGRGLWTSVTLTTLAPGPRVSETCPTPLSIPRPPFDLAPPLPPYGAESRRRYRRRRGCLWIRLPKMPRVLCSS